jgi:hypothetical protein
MIYEPFDGEDCGFGAGVDSGSDINDDGDNDDCSERGISDDSVSDVNMDGIFSIVDDGVTDECDIKGNRDEGFGDDEDNINCDAEVDENKCIDDDVDVDGGGGGVNDDSTGEDGTVDEGGDNDDICDAVAEECKNVRLLWVLTELLAICSTSSICEGTGDNGFLLIEASALLLSSWIVVKVIFCVTREGVSVEVSLNSCEIFGVGPIGE